ncbi:MAG: IS66 family insertion sequence element accessory protein TnpB [Endomicrobium sp.]|nr:IS66 family insertion sequence element accessory protein TnpB [Endomicrobium sp.]
MMILADFKKIFFYKRRVDFRKSIDGLLGIIMEEIKEDPYQRYLFVFLNTHKNKIKTIYWDKTGFALWYKRLEENRFKINIREGIEEVSMEDLKKFLDGYDIFGFKRDEIKKYNFY